MTVIAPAGTVPSWKGNETMAAKQDLKPHQDMWANFVKLIAYSTAAAAIILALMALFLT